MSWLEILVWVVIGGLVGWGASLITKVTRGQGIIGDITVGIMGGLIGGFIFVLVSVPYIIGLSLWSFIVPVIGAAILLVIWKAISRKSKPPVKE